MPPPGGNRSQINVSYGWGQVGNLSGGHDITQQFRDQFQPGAGIFSPSYPLVPVESELTRLWDFPVGYNYIYTPRSYEPVTFAELRALANNENLTRMAIETRKDQLEALDWQIKPIDEKKAAKDSPARIKTLTQFWRHPDGDRSFAAWLRELFEDVLVIDAPCLEVLKNRDGSIRGLDVVDGSTIKLLIDITGRRPTSPAPAFEQVIHGRPWRLLTTEELIYLPRNKRPGHIYGYSPVEQIMMYINIALRRQIMQLNHFTESNMPPGFIGIPDLNPDQVAKISQWWNDLLSGNLAERSKTQFLPYSAKWQSLKEPPFKDEFDEWLARIVMFVFSLPPDAFVRQRNRSTSETARQTAREEGYAPLLGWTKRLIDDVIQRRMGHADLEFSWQELREVDPEVQAKVETTYVHAGIKTVNEGRDGLGLEPIEGGDEAIVVAGATIVLLKDIEDLSDNTANPPEPMFGSPMGGPAGNGVGRGGAAGMGAPSRNDGRRAAPAGTNGARKPAAKPAGARNGSAAAKAALDREARQLLRGARARRVESLLASNESFEWHSEPTEPDLLAAVEERFGRLEKLIGDSRPAPQPLAEPSTINIAMPDTSPPSINLPSINLTIERPSEAPVIKTVTSRRDPEGNLVATIMESSAQQELGGE
jgi:hypothetical protein